MHDNSNSNRKYKEPENLKQNCRNADRAVSKTGYQSQTDNSKYIVNNGGGQNNIAAFRIHTVHFLKCLNSDADTGCRKDYADKQIGDPGVRSGVVKHSNDIVDGKRNKNPKQGDDKRLQSGFSQIHDACFQPGRKHDDDNAKLRKRCDQLTWGHDVEHGRTKNNSGQQRSDNAWHPQLFRKDTKQLGTQKDNRYIQKIVIRLHICTSLFLMGS